MSFEIPRRTYSLGKVNTGENQKDDTAVLVYFKEAGDTRSVAQIKADIKNHKPDGWTLDTSYSSIKDAIKAVSNELDRQHEIDPKCEAKLPVSTDVFDGVHGGVTELYQNGKYAGKIFLDRQYEFEKEKEGPEKKSNIDRLRMLKETFGDIDKENDGPEMEF